MAEIAFVVVVPQMPQAKLGNFIDIGNELVRDIKQDVQDADGTYLKSVVKSDSHLVPDVYAAISSAGGTNPTSTLTGTHTNTSQTIAGAAAGDHTVTGLATTDELVAVVHVDDTTHAGTDKTSEYTITGATTINNTGGTSSVGAHVVVVTRRV